MQQYSLNNEVDNQNLLFDDDVYNIDLDWNFDKDSKKIELTHASSISDGLIYSLRNLGKVDIEYISKITNEDKTLVIDKLKGSIFQDPEEFNGDYFKGFKMADEYLSGNLLKKLQKARFYNIKYRGLFKENIEALEAIMPKGLQGDEIYYTLSSPWIPKHIIKEFFSDEFVYKAYGNNYLNYNDVLNQWEFESCYNINYSSNYKFGTKRITAVKILEHLLNSKTIAIYDYYEVDGKSKKILNQEETALAEDKALELNNHFKKYVERNRFFYEELVNVYNDKFGYNVQRTYNGDFLDFPNMNKDVTLFKSQRDAICRIIFNNNTLLAYNVGAGKTYIMIAAGEELNRIGISKKNLYVVPNNILGQWEKDYKYLYPNSNILVCKTKDFSPDKLESTLNKIKYGNYKAVIMTHSSFDNIKLSKEVEIRTIKEQIGKIESLGYLNSKARQIVKTLNKKLDELLNDNSNYISFDSLGFTRLFLDEAHNYKNIPLESNRGYIKGINLDGSKKCEHLLKICDYMNSLDNSGIIMATGTPISNSISDIYSLQLYLQKGELKLFDINSFDDWLNMFTEETNEYEVDIDSSKYRVVRRLSKFHNLPELTSILANVSAFYFENNTNGLPKFNGYNDILVSKSFELKTYLEKLSERLDDIRCHNVDYKEDNCLKITSDGKKAALDLRLIDSNKYKNIFETKARSCAINVCNIYNKTNDFKGTQLIFCDQSVPSKEFNMYDEMKLQLVKYGIKEDEIEFIHDATTDRLRNKLFKDMNEGKIRVLIGSTLKLGIGVNVQDRLYAIHHLDIPWRPSDMVQREGRIKRFGNKNEEIFIYRYITKGTFDAYSWQILENKQKFIGELLNNSLNERTKEDIENTVLSYGEVKALAIGNPLLQEHVKLKNKLAKLKMLQKKYNDERISYKKELLYIPKQIENLDLEISKTKLDLDFINNNQFEYSKDDKAIMRSNIWNTLMDNLSSDNEKIILNYKGFNIISPKDLIENNLYLIIENNNRYYLELGSSSQGIMIRLDNFFSRFENDYNSLIEKKNNLLLKQESLNNELKNEIDYTKEIIETIKQIEILNKELELNGKNK